MPSCSNSFRLPGTFRSILTEGIADKRLRSLYLRAGTESLWDLRRHPAYVGYSLVALYCWHRREEIVDGLVELLIQLVHKINTNAEKKLVKELLSEVRAVHGKSRLLYKLADAALRNPEGTVKDVLYAVVDEETLEALVKEYEAKGPTYQRHIQTLVRSSYAGHYRAMVPKILEALTFPSNNAHHRPVIEALAYLKGLQGYRLALRAGVLCNVSRTGHSAGAPSQLSHCHQSDAGYF